MVLDSKIARLRDCEVAGEGWERHNECGRINTDERTDYIMRAGRVGKLEGRLAAMLRARQWEREDQMDQRAQENHDFNMMNNRRNYEWDGENRPYMLRAMEARTDMAEQNLKDMQYQNARRTLEDQRKDQARERWAATPEGRKELDAKDTGAQYRRPEETERERLANERAKIGNQSMLLNWNLYNRAIKGELNPAEEAAYRMFGGRSAGSRTSGTNKTEKASGTNGFKTQDYVKNFTPETVAGMLSELGYNPAGFDLGKLHAGAIENLYRTEGEDPKRYLERILQEQGHQTRYAGLPGYSYAYAEDMKKKIGGKSNNPYERSVYLRDYVKKNQNLDVGALQRVHKEMLQLKKFLPEKNIQNLEENQRTLRYFDRALNVYKGNSRAAYYDAIISEYCDRNNIPPEQQQYLKDKITDKKYLSVFNDLSAKNSTDWVLRSWLNTLEKEKQKTRIDKRLDEWFGAR